MAEGNFELKKRFAQSVSLHFLASNIQNPTFKIQNHFSGGVVLLTMDVRMRLIDSISSRSGLT